ncbi:enoyl-CoA hydratase/isomerase family protein [Rhodoplanes azumiensis]|uniref:Enoyl-CoA hydratase/isomerase family protein n=1 Tax=Rhodoplanes azumiensis TaxID=1897628 RepID=A0ABW5AIN7_9BRAD
MSNVIRSSRDGAVVTLVIDRPEEKNLLTIAQVRELTAAIGEAAASDAKAIVIRANGPDFCRGRDPRDGSGAPNALALRTSTLEPILAAYAAIEAAPQPVIALVHGAAHGFGSAVTSACDIAVAADTARFKLPEMEHNLPPTLAMSAVVPNVSKKALAWMVLALEELSAAQALQIGLVSKVVPEADLDAALEKVLATVTSRAAPSLVAVKDFLRVAYHMEPRGLADYSANALATVLSSRER